MSTPRLLCVPNFSEGRNEETIRAILSAIQSAGVRLHTASSDWDHHRLVVAFSGTPLQVKRAVLRAGAVAVERIDLRHHRGVHPRIGAVDVVPFVPLEGMTREQAVQFSHQVAKRFARQLRVPVYLYEHSAGEGRIRDLPTLRKGEFEEWVGKRLHGLRKPDYGPARLHPSAGATIMGVRDPLIAFNVNLKMQGDGFFFLCRSRGELKRKPREKNFGRQLRFRTTAHCPFPTALYRQSNRPPHPPRPRPPARTARGEGIRTMAPHTAGGASITEYYSAPTYRPREGLELCARTGARTRC